MKITVYVVNTCIPERGAEPCMPMVFSTEAGANAYADAMMRGEWANAGTETDDGQSEPYPGDWRKAQERLAQNFDDGSWGTWEITTHHLDLPSAPQSGDHDAMLAIQEQIDGVEWTPDTLDSIAAIMIGAGYRIRDLNDVDLPAPSSTADSIPDAPSLDDAADPIYGMVDWQCEVANGDTRLGYAEWVMHQREAEADRDVKGG